MTNTARNISEIQFPDQAPNNPQSAPDFPAEISQDSSNLVISTSPFDPFSTSPSAVVAAPGGGLHSGGVSKSGPAAPVEKVPIAAHVLKAKLSILADAAKYDASCSSSGSYRKRTAGGLGNTEGMGICHSYTPDGRCVSLLKILLTNFCIYDCKFCINRVSSDTKRAKFTPAEVVWLTLEFYRRNYIEGLFLSSGIIESSDATMEMLIEVARSLRQDHKFGGYIHLKVVAGASEELIHKAGLWADRLSANIEMPVQNDLNILAPAKTIAAAEGSMDQIKDKLTETKEDQKRFVKTPKFAPAGQTTQMIVGATGSTDALILNSSSKLYGDFKLRRVYYSAYSPIPNADALLPVERPALIRENRLYQADWLMRFYEFKAGELTTAENPQLSLDMDPKSSWALGHRQFFPLDVNKASREQLLRVPGFGVRNVDRIIQTRRYRKLRVEDLKKLRVTWNRSKYFVITADHNPDLLLLDDIHLERQFKPKAQQLSLFDLSSSDAGSLAAAQSDLMLPTDLETAAQELRNASPLLEPAPLNSADLMDLQQTAMTGEL